MECEGESTLKRYTLLSRTCSCFPCLDSRAQKFSMTDLHCQTLASKPRVSLIQFNRQPRLQGGSNHFAPRIFLDNTAWFSRNMLWKYAAGCVLCVLGSVSNVVLGWDHEGHGFRRLKWNNKLILENVLLSGRDTSCLPGSGQCLGTLEKTTQLEPHGGSWWDWGQVWQWDRECGSWPL